MKLCVWVYTVFMTVTIDQNLVSSIRSKYNEISFCLNERSRRLWCAAEAKSYGYGGIKAVCIATGVAKSTIIRGIKELSDPAKIAGDMVRRGGGGRKSLCSHDNSLVDDLNELVAPATCGSPMSPLRWSSKSTYKLRDELQAKGHKVSQKTVYNLLDAQEYSLQANRKTKEKADDPDRDNQFNYIANQTELCHKNHEPVISVDTKKKENIGEYKNNGKEYCPKGKPIEVNGHDFIDKNLGKVAPYGIYDIGKNTGWVNVGISSDTAQFAVNAIRSWWYNMGITAYKSAKKITITADCGGSNGNRVRLWKIELQKLANEINKEIQVLHFPPGTSKWNKIEHRMFSYISQNWRGRPLISREAVVNLIAATTTRTGLVIKAMLDNNTYQTGIKIAKRQVEEECTIVKHNFRGEWNYNIVPNNIEKK